MTDIKAFRKANNLTQEQLAVYLGTGKSFISLVENGRCALPEQKFMKILNNTNGWDVSMLERTKPKIGIPLISIEAMADVLSIYSAQVMGHEC